MTVNVHLELGEVLTHLEFKMNRDGIRETVETRLGLNVGRLFEGEERLEVEQLLQILAVMDVHPCDFFLEVYRRQCHEPETYQEELRLELIRLLNENLEVFCDRPHLPRPDRPPIADSRLVDFVLLKERGELAVNSVRDLAAVARWMMTRLPPADRKMLIGLCERLGTFDAAIDAIPGLLAIVETPVEAAWSMEHQRQLMLQSWHRVDDVADDINLRAVLFLMDLEIKAGRCQDVAEMVKLRERLAPEKEGDDVP